MRAVPALLLLLAAVQADEPVRLIVLHTNDLHGQLAPLPPSPSPTRGALRGKPAGGFAHLAGIVRAVRREGPPVLLIDGGDLFQGTPVGNETKGDAVVDAMNALGYDAGALGNHEFDYGFANLKRLVARATFPLLAANMAPARGVKPLVVLGPPRFPCRIAVIGLITTGTPYVTTPGVTRGLKFADPVPVVRALMRETEADLFVVASHLGRDEELRLARSVDGLAVIAGGHSHTPYTQTVNGTLVQQTAGRTLTLGRVDLELDPQTWRVAGAKGRIVLVDPGATPADPKVAAVIEKHARDIDARMAQVVGKLAVPLRRQRGPVSSPAGNWMSDVLRRAGNADIGFMNKGGIRTDLEAGDVTKGDVYRLMPFDNTLVSLDLTGAQVRAVLKRNFSARRFPGLEWSGLFVELDADGRVASVTVGGAPLDDAKAYRVATNSFIAAGGDGFATFRDGANVERGRVVRDLLQEAFAEHSPITPDAEPRLRVRAPK